MEPGEEECHDKEESSIIEVPEESCDLNPMKTCRFATKLVPKLDALQECSLVPKERSWNFHKKIMIIFHLQIIQGCFNNIFFSKSSNKNLFGHSQKNMIHIKCKTF